MNEIKLYTVRFQTEGSSNSVVVRACGVKEAERTAKRRFPHGTQFHAYLSSRKD